MFKIKMIYFILSLILFFIFSFSIISPVLAGVSGGTQPVNLENPLGEKDIRKIIGRVISAALGIVGSLALVIFIFGGVTWMTSGGNEEKIKKGKQMILWAALGLAVIFASYAAVRFILTSLTGAAGG